eukprot:3276607-Prymnesium_polylepis.1
MDNILRAFEKCLASIVTTEQVLPPSNLRESSVFAFAPLLLFTARPPLALARWVRRTTCSNVGPPPGVRITWRVSVEQSQCRNTCG